jgi:hypothetical protein
MDGCNFSIIFLIFYIVALTFVMKTHFHYIGYILLLIVYLVNILYVALNRGTYMAFIDGVLPSNALSFLTQNSALKFLLFIIMFFSLYSLIRMVDTYGYMIKKQNTYDIPLSKYHKNNVFMFNVSFIVATVLLMGFLMLISMGVVMNQMVLWAIPLLSLVFVGLQFAYSYTFSSIKYDFVKRQGSKL